MTPSHLAKFRFVAVLTAAVVVGCSTRDTVRVVDSETRLPIRGARVVPVYPSMGGPDGLGYVTDENGVATIGEFGLPRGGYGVYVSAPNYSTNFISTDPTAGKRIDSDDHRLEVFLESFPKP